MDKETLSNYGWIVICTLVLAVLLALAGPFGTFVADAVKSTTAGLFNVNQNALGAAGITIDGQEFDSCEHDYEVTTTANCTTAGTTTYTCKLCGKSYSEETPAGHTFDNASDLTCNVCNVKFTEYAFKASDYDAKMGTTTATDTVVEIPETFEYNGTKYKVTTLASYAFATCANLKEVVIPDSVRGIGTYAFENCTSLADITIPDNTGISAYAFRNCTSLTNIELPKGITRILVCTFSNCTALTSIDLSKCTQLNSIGNHAFDGCTSLENVILPDGITEIGSSTFRSTAITQITIPASVTSILSNAFLGCASLTSVTFENPSGWTAGGTVFSAEELANTLTAATYLKSTTYYNKSWARSE